MRWFCAPLLIAALSLSVGDPAPASARPPACSSGRYLVDGAPLVPDVTEKGRQGITIADGTISIGSVCQPVACSLLPAKGRTRVKARWSACVGLARPVKLKATFDPSCTVLTGVRIARRVTPKRRRFMAAASVCGDGIVDAAAGEECDGRGCGAAATCDEARCVCIATAASIARQWDEEALAAIRRDIPRPPVHARNLFHLSVAMWDAWVAYDQTRGATGYLTTERHASVDPAKDRVEALSFAAYRILSARYAHAFGAEASLASFDAKMLALGYETALTSTAGDSPAAVGNRIAAAVLAFGASDGANEASDYADPTYTPVNEPLIVKLAGATMVDPNRWQPLALDYILTQNGIPLPGKVQEFVGPQWGAVTPFAFDLSSHPAPPPPRLGGVGDEEYKRGFIDNIRKSSVLDPGDGVYVDISPAAKGNNPLGTNDGTGHPTNPVTGAPYVPNVVRRGDWSRVIVEFWADGPHSETPPGHWNVIANYVSDRLGAGKRIAGTGPAIDSLEWDVKLYLALNGALHDAAIGCWGTKRQYDSVRPISAVRYMAGLGQSSDVSQTPYHPAGLPLVPDLVEIITPATTVPGARHAALAGFEGEIAVRTWPGPPGDPSTEVGGVRWVRAATWVPYQKATFVTPAFAGYPSGHSTFSRAAAEVMTALTGSAFFPAGLGDFVAAKDVFLTTERGPTETVVLQWATYYDAADDAGLSRQYGGIHPFFDDMAGRMMGATIGQQAFALASIYYGEPSSERRTH
jgi:hypothetical protein